MASTHVSAQRQRKKVPTEDRGTKETLVIFMLIFTEPCFASCGSPHSCGSNVLCRERQKLATVFVQIKTGTLEEMNTFWKYVSTCYSINQGTNN